MFQTFPISIQLSLQMESFKRVAAGARSATASGGARTAGWKILCLCPLSNNMSYICPGGVQQEQWPWRGRVQGGVWQEQWPRRGWVQGCVQLEQWNCKGHVQGGVRQVFLCMFIRNIPPFQEGLYLQNEQLLPFTRIYIIFLCVTPPSRNMNFSLHLFFRILRTRGSEEKGGWIWSSREYST